MKYLGRTQDGKPLKSVKENISIITMDLGEVGLGKHQKDRRNYTFIKN